VIVWSIKENGLFTFYLIGVLFLLMTLIMALAILKGNPVKVGNLLVPSVFGGVGLSFLSAATFGVNK